MEASLVEKINTYSNILYYTETRRADKILEQFIAARLDYAELDDSSNLIFRSSSGDCVVMFADYEKCEIMPLNDNTDILEVCLNNGKKHIFLLKNEDT